jgi:hypothetical protein
MTRGEHQQIPSAKTLLAAACTQAEQAPRITIPLPSVPAMKTASWWTLGIVLGICAMPVALGGWFVTASIIASVFYPRYSEAYVVFTSRWRLEGSTARTWACHLDVVTRPAEGEAPASARC